MNQGQKVKFITLGCKVNQYETQGMREILAREGVTTLEEASHALSHPPKVDFVVINTCTVTEDADRTNRYWIRRAKRDYPSARIVVTGCWVGKDRATIAAIPEVDLVLANEEKADIANRLVVGCANPAVQDEDDPPRRVSRRNFYTPLSISRTSGRGRAFVKIQDGCNHACSFCKVVLVRGRSRSRAFQEVLEEVKRLRDAGYREVVFAGIQLGAYGLDFEKKTEPGEWLAQLLESSSEIAGIDRLRLSSIEPTDVRPVLIDALRDIPKVCHHLHIPLQSGDDEILKRMNRRYARSFYLDLVARLKGELSDFSLTLDVMAGFPGEGEGHFQNTMDLLEQVKPLKCHVFPYSRREGTRAASFEEVPPEFARRRVNSLIELGDRIGRDIRLSYQGRAFSVLVEEVKKDTDHALRGSCLLKGLTSHYLKVCFEGKSEWVGEIIPVKLLSLQGDTFLGEVLR